MKSKRLAFWFVFVVFAAIAGWTGHYHLFGNGFFRPVLVVPDKISFGTVSDLADLPEQEFLITNGGLRPLRIEGIRPGCSGCIEVISFPKTPIYRNETVMVQIALKTEGLSGNVRKALLITSNDPRRPFYPVLIDAFIENKKEEADGDYH